MVQAVHILKRHALYTVALIIVTLFGHRPLSVTAALSVIVLLLSLDSKNSVWFYIIASLVFTLSNMLELVYARPCEPVDTPVWIIPRAAIHAQWAMDIFCMVGIMSGPRSDDKPDEHSV